MTPRITRQVRTLVSILSTLACLAATATAHEFWIRPSAYSVAPDTVVRAELFHGERFAGELVARNTPQIARYEFIAPGESAEVRGIHGRAIGFLRPQAPGIGQIVYESTEYIHTLPADRFEAYLAEEGLDEISERRSSLGETSLEGREAYVRCAKAIVNVGGVAQADAPPPLGLPFEIVLDGPLPSASSETIHARLLFGGEPLPGRRVVLACELEPGRLVEGVTDSDGRVTLAIPGRGALMLTSLHMVRTEGRDDIDWKSYWASITLDTAG